MSVGENRFDLIENRTVLNVVVPMSLASFASALSIFWLILHCIHWISHHSTRRTPEPILPSHRPNLLRNTTNGSFNNNCQWHITLRFLHARIETSSLNRFHDKLLIRLKKKAHLESRTWLERFYTLGYVSGVIGMVVALGLLLWTTWTLIKPFSFHKIVRVSKSVGKLMMKRDVPEVTYQEALTPKSPITPIIPGVTVPLNHLPFILTTLFLSQLIHELGHAIAGALYNIPILSSGASLIICIPAAFVSYSTTALDTLRPPPKSRIISAGPFHNLLFWCFCFLTSYIGSGLFWTFSGYKDISALGRVVLKVEDDSPLAGHLTTGAIIIKLNDHSMASSSVDPDPWNSFLKSTSNGDIFLGWCIDSNALDSSGKECCLPDESRKGTLSCFVANTVPTRVGCMDPVPILTSTKTMDSCESGTDCRNGHVCVRPAETEELLRLTIKGNELEPDKVVLWSGPREEVWNEVTVGVWLPRLSFLPIRLPLWGSVFWEYLIMVNLSLFLFNLLPLGNLDGQHFLHSMMLSSNKDEVFNLDALERAETPNESRWGMLEKAICRGTGVLVALDSVLILLALIRI